MRPLLASLEIFQGPLGPIVILVIALLFFGHRLPHLFSHKKDAQHPPPSDAPKLSAPDKPNPVQPPFPQPPPQQKK